LFHNRIQSWRRTDAGRYQWQRGGRLDRWLESCRYPNLGHAGLRDFEHLESHFEGGRHFFYAVGDHFLSLALVAGSCFRFQDPNRIGLDGQGRPIDARDLFDTSILASWLERFFLAYYRGLNGRDFPGPCPLPPTGLAQGLVEALGRDQYMQEVLREQDLEYLGPTKVAAYLQSRGLDREQAQFLSHSDQELVIHSGPHLGEFNGRLEVPALLDYIAMASSICLAGRYFLEQHLDWESEFWALVASARQDQQGLGPSLRA
jgi:hypothetical protein